jgi:osmoprotectant transport system permease protein
MQFSRCVVQRQRSSVLTRFVLAAAISTTASIASAVPASAQPIARRDVVVASKPFGESYLLAEMFAQLLERSGRTVQRRMGLGATEVAFSAIRTGAIDVYPEYVGTGLVAILGDSVTPAMRAEPRVAFAQVASRSVARFGVHWLAPLGFQNGYAIAVRRETSTRYRLRTLSDLAASPARLTAGFTSDFIGRGDGWPGVRTAYGLTLADVRPLAPGLKYEALARGAVDIIDGYSTDGLLAKYDLVTLEDDRHFFPPYDAAAIVSKKVFTGDPGAVAVLSSLSGRLSEVQMRAWNRAIEVDRRPVDVVAREALAEVGLGDASRAATLNMERRSPNGFWQFMQSRASETLRLTLEHLQLVTIALSGAILVAVPLGLWLVNRPRLAGVVLQGLGVVQTIPGLALLAFMIPLLGIGAVPATLALFAYALLPIARATVAGLRIADSDAAAALESMGATPRQALLWVRLPLAAPIVLSGIRTAAVLTIGTATLAAFIGGVGLGEPIVTGLGLADMRLVLSGAIPAAVLAVTVDALLALVERLVAPAHLR